MASTSSTWAMSRRWRTARNRIHARTAMALTGEPQRAANAASRRSHRNSPAAWTLGWITSGGRRVLGLGIPKDSIDEHW